MHPTTHSPTPREQIKCLLNFLALAVGCALVTIALMFYTGPAEKSYILAAPEILPRIDGKEPSLTFSRTRPSTFRLWHFDSIVLSFIDLTIQKLTNRALSSTAYAHLVSDASLNKIEGIEKPEPISAESSWATYHHKDLVPLLYSLTQEAS